LQRVAVPCLRCFVGIFSFAVCCSVLQCVTGSKGTTGTRRSGTVNPHTHSRTHTRTHSDKHTHSLSLSLPLSPSLSLSLPLALCLSHTHAQTQGAKAQQAQGGGALSTPMDLSVLHVKKKALEGDGKGVLQGVAVCCSALQCVAVCCSVL